MASALAVMPNVLLAYRGLILACLAKDLNIAITSLVWILALLALNLMKTDNV